MNKRIIILGLSFISLLSAFSQNFSIFGRIMDGTTQEFLSNVSIKLNNSDSVLLKSEITGSTGKFEIENVKTGDYILTVSSIGYKSLTFSLKNLDRNYDLENIYLSERVTELSEYVVTANTNRYEIDRQIIIVTESLRERSQDAFDLLYHSSLPELRYNIADKSLSSLKNGNLQLRIDGIVHEISDLSTILPQDVTSIEYIDQPGIRYGDGVVAVINIKTKRKTAGYQVGVNTSNAIIRVQGRDNLYVRRITSYDILSLTGGFSYQKSKSEYSDSWVNMYFPDDLKNIVRSGIPQENKNQNINTKLEYTRFLSSNLTISSFVNYNFSNNPDNIIGYNTIENNSLKYSEKTNSDDKSHNLALDIYLDWKIRKDQNLFFNLTGTYISSKYEREYGSDISQILAYNTKGKRKSIITELIYEKTLDESGRRFSAGVRSFMANTDNSYSGSTGNIDPFMKNRDLYVFAEIRGNFSKLGYSLGMGFSTENFKEYGLNKTYNFFRPSLNLAYPLDTQLKLIYSLRVNPLKPTLSDMTEIRQPINNYEIMEGNPYLRPYQAYANTLTLGYYVNSTVISLTGYLQYNDKPIMGDPINYSDENGVFIRKKSNQKSFIHGQFKLYASQDLFNDKLNLSAFGVMNRYINNGNDFVTTMTAFIYGTSISFSEKLWGVTADFTSPIKTKFAHVKRDTSLEFQLYGYYKYQDCTFGLGILNPFINNIPINKSKEDYIEYRSYVKNYNANQLNRLFFTFTWNFQSGKSKSYKKQLNNTDIDTGIVK